MTEREQAMALTWQRAPALAWFLWLPQPTPLRGYRTMSNTGKLPPDTRQVVLVLQGGGALGAYQAGVYQALHEAGIEPDWVIGTSIGAINASLIAGNEPPDRLARLKEFWRRVEHGPFHQACAPCRWSAAWRRTGSPWRAASPSFFKPNPMAFAGVHMPLGAEAAGVLFDGAAGGDAGRAGELRPHQPRRAAPDGRCGECAHQRDALFRQPRACRSVRAM